MQDLIRAQFESLSENVKQKAWLDFDVTGRQPRYENEKHSEERGREIGNIHAPP